MRTPHAGYATRRDLTKLARSSFVPLVALIAFGIVLVFIDIPDGSLIYAVAGLVIFAGLILFDFQRLRQAKDIRTAPLLAASIFLDVLNVFVLFLSIFSGSSEECLGQGERPPAPPRRMNGAGRGRRPARGPRR